MLFSIVGRWGSCVVERRTVYRRVSHGCSPMVRQSWLGDIYIYIFIYMQIIGEKLSFHVQLFIHQYRLFRAKCTLQLVSVDNEYISFTIMIQNCTHKKIEFTRIKRIKRKKLYLDHYIIVVFLIKNNVIELTRLIIHSILSFALNQ